MRINALKTMKSMAFKSTGGRMKAFGVTSDERGKEIIPMSLRDMAKEPNKFSPRERYCFELASGEKRELYPVLHRTFADCRDEAIRQGQRHGAEHFVVHRVWLSDTFEETYPIPKTK